MSYDTILEQVGAYGKFQKRVVLMVAFTGYPYAVQVLLTVFSMATSEFRCSVPGLENDTYEIQSSHHKQLVNTFIPFDQSEDRYSECSIYPNWTSSGQVGGTNSTSACSSWVYNRDVFTTTLVTDLDLVCERKIWATQANMYCLVGAMVSALVSGVLADRIGRKKVIVFGGLLSSIAGLTMAFTASIPMLLVMRFLVCFFSLAVYMTGCTYCMELVGPSKRTLAGTLVHMGWVFGMFMLVFVSYFVRDWQTLQLILSAPNILIVFYYWLIPESPRWIFNKGRTEEGTQMLNKIAKANGKTFLLSLSPEQEGVETKFIEMDPVSNNSNTQDTRTGEHGCFRLVKSGVLMKHTLIMSINWAGVTMTYYGVGLNVGSLVEGNRFLNFFIMAVLEGAAYIVVPFLLDRIGRRLLFCTCLLLGGVSCLATIIPELLNQRIAWVNVVLANLGRFFANICFGGLYIYTIELFPTAYRNSGLGVCSFIGRIGGVVSPYVANMNYIVGGKFGKVLPLIVFGGVAVFSGFLTLLLPETKGLQLPATIEEAEALSTRKNKSKRPPDSTVA